MKIFGFPLSPFVRKVTVAAREKGLDYELIPANPSQPTEEFLKVSPFGKIPAFSDGEFCIADSTAIVTYLEAKYPRPALLPAAPEARARAIWFEEVNDTVLVPGGAPIVVNRFLRPKIFGTEGDESAAQAAEEALGKPLGYLEGELGEGGWMAGEFSIGDIALACTFKTLGYAGWSLDAGLYPRLAEWFGRMSEREGWVKAADEEAQVFAAMGG